MNNGWIKMHRKIINKGWYKKSDHKSVWYHLLLKANHQDNEFWFNGKNIIIKKGQFVTGRKKLSLELGISESKIERILKFFEKSEHQIEQQKTNKNRLITILNWSEYQSSEHQIEQPVNNQRTTSEQPVNTNKKEENVENVKNEKKKESSLSFQEALILVKVFYKNLPEKLRDKYSKERKNWIDSLEKCIRLDKYTPEQIEKIIIYFRNDNFWSSNFISPIKLRKLNNDGIKYIDFFWNQLESKSKFKKHKPFGTSTDFSYEDEQTKKALKEFEEEKKNGSNKM